MILQFYKLIGKDRQLEHPAFGVLSCNAIQDSHKKCVDLMNTNSMLDIQCKTLYELSIPRYFRAKLYLHSFKIFLRLSMLQSQIR